MTSRVTRRGALLALAGIVACRKTTPAAETRCPTCGMKIDPASAWRAELVTASGPVSFDTPRIGAARPAMQLRNSG